MPPLVTPTSMSLVAVHTADLCNCPIESEMETLNEEVASGRLPSARLTSGEMVF